MWLHLLLPQAPAHGKPKPPAAKWQALLPPGTDGNRQGEASAALGLEKGTARAEPRLLPRPQSALLPVTVSSAALGQPLWKGEGKARDPGDCPDA